MDKIVGIMGGTFNPIHNGHIEMIKAVHRQFNIQKILVMPSGTPAYKDNSHIVSAIDRCNMVSLAIKEYPYMELSTMEVTRKGNTYTADTLKILKNDYDLKEVKEERLKEKYGSIDWCKHYSWRTDES